MKKMFKTSLALILAVIMTVPTLIFSATAAGEVYTLNGERTVFVGAGETVSVDGSEYNTYATLTQAFAALGKDGGVIAVVGEFTDATTNGDSTFSDVAGRNKVTIKGIGSGAVINFNHTLKFLSDTAFDNFKLNCTSTKYIETSGITEYTETFSYGGGIYLRAANTTPANGVSRVTFNGAGQTVNQFNAYGGYSTIGSANDEQPVLSEFVFNNVTLKCPINLGSSNNENKSYSNINAYINGGTFSDKNFQYLKAARTTGAVSVIFNNGMSSGFSVNVKDINEVNVIDYVIDSATGGMATIKTQAPKNGAPTFKFVPESGKVPAIDGVLLLANDDGEYLLTPKASDSVQVFKVTYLEQSGENSKAAFYSIDGVKTAFVKNGGGSIEYNGVQAIAFDSIKSALTANTNKADITVVIVGSIENENLQHPNLYPSGLLTVTGADENASLQLVNSAHPWGNVCFKNINLNCAGAFSADGNKIVFGEGLTGTMPTILYGGGSSSPHGGNLEIHSGVWKKIVVGSDAVTSAESSKTQCHNLTIYGGDFTNATIDFGSTVSTTVPKNVIFTVNGGTFAENQKILMSNVTEIGGISAVIYNNGTADSTSFSVDEKFTYTVKSGENGSVSYDGTNFAISPNNGYAAIADGKVSATNLILPDETKVHTVEYVKTNGNAKAYETEDGKVSYVKTGGGLCKIDDNSKAYYAYSDIRKAITENIGGKIVVIGEYKGTMREFWSGNAVTTITGEDENAVLTLTAFYMWTPIVFENIKLSGASDWLNADSRALEIGENVTAVGDGLKVIGSSAAATARNTDVTIKSGKYSSVIGGNIASTQGLSINLSLEGGDFSEATVNLGNTTANTLNGNAILKISGGTFADGQKINYSNLTTLGNAVAIIENDVDKKYNLVFDSNFDVVLKMRSGGKYEIESYGNSTTKPTFVFTPDDALKAPCINGEMLSPGTQGKYRYTPAASETDIEVTWAVDTRPKAYVIDEVATSFVSANGSVEVGGTTYYAFDTLTKAIAALCGAEGKVIIASDVSNTGGDGVAFVDTADREAVTIEGLTGNEVLTLDGTFGFLGDVVLDKFTLVIPKSVWAKYINGYGNVTFGKNFKINTTGNGVAYFAPYNSTTPLSHNINVTAKGGSIDKFNVVGAYAKINDGFSITSEIDGATVRELNFGYAEVNKSLSGVYGAINLIISSDTVSTKTVTTTENSVPYMYADGTYTLIFNNGIKDYTVSENTKAILDYIVYSAGGGKVGIHSNGNSQTAPTFLLVPNDGYSPRINGIYIEETADGYLYTPEFTGKQTEINVEWIDSASMSPVVYEIGGERTAFVKNGGGVIYFGGEVKFAYADINSAVAALGADGGNVLFSGNVKYVYNGNLNTNVFADTVGRKAVTINGIEGTNPVLTYYKNADLKGDLTVDNCTMHRLADTLWDTGFVTNGHNLTIGKNLITTTDFSQNMTIHGVSGTNITLDKPQIITIKGGGITRVLPGTTWSASTLNGNSIINIEGGSIDSVFGGSHGGQNFNSIINGDVEINISGGKVVSVYSGGNSKSVINGNVVVNVSGGTFVGTSFRHGNGTVAEQNVLNGNSVFVVSGGEFSDAKFGDGTARGVTGEEIFIVDLTLDGYTVNLTENGTFIKYDPDGTVNPKFDSDGNFVGYEISCDDDGADVVIDGVKATPKNGNIYEIGRGEHTVLFSTLYDIEFDLNGAQGTVPNSIEKYNDTEVELSAPNAVMKNHYFNGWSTDKNAEKGSLMFTVPNDNTTLYAIWTEIKPCETENSNIENSKAQRIVVSSIAEADYDSNSSVVTAKNAAQNDVLIINGSKVIYAFKVSAYDADGGNVTAFANGINLKIPKSVLEARKVGEFYRIYKVADQEVSILQDGAEVISYTEDENYLYFTDYEIGDYTVVLASASFADYTYKGTYDEQNGKYTLVLTFSGAEANYGSFGLRYNTEQLELESCSFNEDKVNEAGNISLNEGGFNTYYNNNGIYQNTWVAANDHSIDATTDPVEICTFVFKTVQEFAISVDTFAVADFANTGLNLDKGTIETVFENNCYLYSPCVPSTEVYCQPINTSFDVGVIPYKVTAGYVINRDADKKWYSDSETGYNSAAKINISLNGNVVFSTSEDKLNITDNGNGKAVIAFEANLGNGTYEICFIKNGYVKNTATFTINNGDVNLGNITPVCGDIKTGYDSECGDGIVDIDDFINVIKGFGTSDSLKKLRQAVDIDESGDVNVTDLGYVKASMAQNIAE